MNYILIGLLVSFGWQVARVIINIAEELLFERLHKAKWYLVAAGRKPRQIEEKPGDPKAVKSRIGFY